MNAQKLVASDFGITPNQLSADALEVITHLKGAGYEAYIVGGFIRDVLSGLHPKDFDVATNATPEQVVECVPRSRLIGRRFKLVHAHFGRGRHSKTIEIATFRASTHSPEKADHISSSGQIIRDNTYGSIEQDAARRDFTANALYYDPEQDLLLDFLGALDDIQARRLRIIGDPEQRFTEDPVRVMRAIRFVAKLNWEIEENTEKAMYSKQHLIRQAAPARLFDEVLKLMLSEYAWKSWQGIERYGVDDTLFPHTARDLADAPYRQLLKQAAAGTEQRIRADKPVNPAFIYAILLWPAVALHHRNLLAQGLADYPALQGACSAALDQQQPHITIPRRFALVMREIWLMQLNMGQQRPKQIARILGSARFRAAYDFFEMRVKAQDQRFSADEDKLQWWTQIQECDDQQRSQMINELPNRRSRRKRRPRKKRY